LDGIELRVFADWSSVYRTQWRGTRNLYSDCSWCF